MKKLLLTTLIILMFSSVSFAQSRFLEEGENGFGLGLGFQNTTTSTKGIGFVDLGYFFNGRVDLGAKYGKNVNIRIIASYLNISLAKQSKVTPFTFNLMLQGEVAKNIYKYYYGSKTSSSIFSVGGILEHKFSLGNSGIVPFLSVYRAVNDGSNNNLTAGGGLSFFTGGKTVFSLNAGYYSTNEYRYDTFVISLSIMFKKGKK